jgi:hypothetical protein
MKYVGLFILYVSIIFASALLNGWAFVKLWGWFVIPYFNVPELTIPVAIGIALLIGMLTTETPKTDSSKKASTEDGVVNIVSSLLRPVFVVATGYVVTLFM